MEAGEKAALMKKAYNTLILCLGDRVLREVTKETTVAGIWTKLTSLYMTKSLANRLYLKKKPYTYYISPGTKLGDHIDEFNKFILDLANIDIEIEDEDRALMLLTSLPLSYENFVETLLYRREYLTMEDVLATLNSRESDHSGKAHSGGSSQFKSRGGTGKLKCFICNSEGHLKRDCPKKRSSGFVKKSKRDQDSNSSDDEGNAYFGEALAVVRNDETTELVMDSGGPYHMTHMREFLYDFKVFDCGSVRFGDNRTCTIKGTGKVKIQLHDGSSFILEDVRIKVIKGCRVMMTGIRKKNCIYTLEVKVMTFGVQKHGGSKQVGLKQLGSKQVGFKQLSHKQVGFKQLGPGIETGVHRVQVEKRVWFEVELQGAQRDREAEGFQVSNDDTAVAQRQLEDKQLEENTNTDSMVKEQEKVHLGIKVWANITVTGVTEQEGTEGSSGVEKVFRGTNTAYPTNVYGVLGNAATDTAYYKSKRQEKMVDEHHKEVPKASTSKGAESLIDDAIRDESENESSSDSEGLNYGGFTKEETKALRSMINKQVGKAIKNVTPFYISQTTDNLKEVIQRELEELKKGGMMNDSRNEMATYRDFMACDVPKFDGTLDPIACTKWLSAVEGAFCTSCYKEKNKVNFASNFLRDSAKMWWEGKICEKEEWIGTCTWKKFKEMFTTEYTPVEEVDKIQEEFLTITQTNETVNEMWKKFNHLIRYCIEYHGNEKLKVEKFQRMLRNDIREVISPFKCTTLEDLLSRARLREADLLRKKNKDTKRKLDFVDRDAKKPKL
ncbi:zinc finger, CCHC-type containing protein [Tanacetum coccineum]